MLFESLNLESKLITKFRLMGIYGRISMYTFSGSLMEGWKRCQSSSIRRVDRYRASSCRFNILTKIPRARGGNSFQSVQLNGSTFLWLDLIQEQSKIFPFLVNLQSTHVTGDEAHGSYLTASTCSRTVKCKIFLALLLNEVQ